jgi:hypothetical protein
MVINSKRGLANKALAVEKIGGEQPIAVKGAAVADTPIVVKKDGHALPVHNTPRSVHSIPKAVM